MSLFEDINPRELKDLLRQIHACEAVLPDFQRDFVWEPNATQELIVSIANNYPAGSLLRIRNTHNLFASRVFENAPELNGHHPTYLVLDGQQRLTSLYQAFYGVGEHRYFLDLRKLIDGAEFEECIFFLRANKKDAIRYATDTAQADELILPLAVLKGGTGDFAKWSRKITRLFTDHKKRTETEDSLDKIEDKWIRPIDDYKFPVVTLSDQVNAEAVCTIFETLNRTGVKLTAFELLTARFWPQNINLRRLWEKAQADHPVIADFEIDPYYALQAISLASRPTPSCKRADVLDLNAATINLWWDRVVASVATAMEILRDDCGVVTPGWLPYNTIVPPLAAVLASHKADAHSVGAVRNKLCRWFWCSVFAQIYDSAANSQSAKDVTELLRWLGGGAPPETVSGFKFDPQLLDDTTARQRALYRGLICLTLRRGPRDFHNGAPITGDLMIEHHIDDHHIFPNAYLGGLGVPSRQRDCIINRTLIDRTTNIRISARAPSDYLAEVKTALGPAAFDKLLESHLLPTGSASPLLNDSFAAFTDWRRAAIWDQIKLVTS